MSGLEDDGGGGGTKEVAGGEGDGSMIRERKEGEGDDDVDAQLMEVAELLCLDYWRSGQNKERRTKLTPAEYTQQISPNRTSDNKELKLNSRIN